MELPTNMIGEHWVAFPWGPTMADQKLVKLLPSEKGLDLPEQVQTNLIKDAVRPWRR